MWDPARDGQGEFSWREIDVPREWVDDPELPRWPDRPVPVLPPVVWTVVAWVLAMLFGIWVLSWLFA